MAYLIKEGEGKAIALYTRCANEVFCQAEILLLAEMADVSQDFKGKPIWGVYDIDPSYSVERFLDGYKGRPDDKKRLFELIEKIRQEGWSYQWID